MLKNYLKITFRNLIKYKIYSIVNIAGLAVGMACCILILLWVKNELSYDRFHENSERIFRVVAGGQNAAKGTILALQGPLAPLLKKEFPEVEKYVRIYAFKIFSGEKLVSHQHKHFYTNNFFMVDPSFFEVFSFPFIKGDPRTALYDLRSIVITEEMAKKYFSNDDPLGKILSYENEFDFVVTGVVKNIPFNSHFQFDFIIPLENYRDIQSLPNGLDNWDNQAFVTYLLLNPNCDISSLEKKMTELVNQYTRNDIFTFFLQSLTDIHLYSNLRDELGTNTDIRYVRLFVAIAFLVMLIACLNFINLSTARSLKRAKEVALRKVVGARRTQLIQQFLGESVLVSVLALAVALVLVELLLPAFRNFVGKPLEIHLFFSLSLWLLVLAIVIFTGIFGGIYPAFVLSAFQPVSVFKAKMQKSQRGLLSLRRFLVVIQFAVSICLIICTGIIYKQIKYMQNTPLGFTREQVIIIPIGTGQETVSKAQILKDRFKQHNNIVAVTASSHTPGHRLWGRGIKLLDKPNPEWEKLLIRSLWTDYDFIKTYKITLLAGRDFSSACSSDKSSAFILNETAVRSLGWKTAEAALGNSIYFDEKTGNIIGVVKDFHFRSLHDAIEETILHIRPERFYSLSLRANTSNLPLTLSALKKIWEEILPNRPFEYVFLDEDFAKLYYFDRKVAELMGYFTFLSVFITCLGLFSLVAFSTEQRTKEIGIRKILGATIPNILFLLTKDFTKGVLVANIIAWPVAYYAMFRWLQNFAYRTNIGITTFILSATIALLIAIITVSYQSIKAALANPIEALRYE
jgi:putative ABC transport system permease protein